MQRSEGEPLSTAGQRHVVRGRPTASRMRFQVDAQGCRRLRPSSAPRRADAGDDLRVELTKPAGQDARHRPRHSVSRPSTSNASSTPPRTAAARIEARVYDGSDTGAKIFDTLTVIGKEATKPGDDAETATRSAGYGAGRSSISYFDEAAKDSRARIHALLRPLRERRLGQPQARLRRVRPARRIRASSRSCRRRPARNSAEVSSLRGARPEGEAALHRSARRICRASVAIAASRAFSRSPSRSTRSPSSARSAGASSVAATPSRR